MYSAASYLVATLLIAPTESERTFRFVGGNYSWTKIFETLGKVQGKTYDIKYKPVDEARDTQKKVECSFLFPYNKHLISARQSKLAT